MFNLKLDHHSVIQYLNESHEQLATAEASLLAIEQDRANINDDRIDVLLAAMHRIEEDAETFDLVKIGQLAHQTENALALIRSWKVVPASDVIRTLLVAVGRLDELIENSETSNEADTSELTAELSNLAANRPPIEKSSAAGANNAHRGKRPLRVLLVDDEFTCRLLLQTFLSRYGECHAAVNGSEAVEAFRLALDHGRGYDLICMDILMPKMDGREAVSQIRALERAQGIPPSLGTKIFMTTIVAEVRQVIQSCEELCDAYLMKPIDLGQLLNRMKFYELIP